MASNLTRQTRDLTDAFELLAPYLRHGEPCPYRGHDTTWSDLDPAAPAICTCMLTPRLGLMYNELERLRLLVGVDLESRIPS